MLMPRKSSSQTCRSPQRLKILAQNFRIRVSGRCPPRIECDARLRSRMYRKEGKASLKSNDEICSTNGKKGASSSTSAGKADASSKRRLSISRMPMSSRCLCPGRRTCGAIQSGFCQFHSASAEQMNCLRLGHHSASGICCAGRGGSER